MSFANEKLYKGYLRKNMPTIVSNVKPREIVPHLPCLTDHDRENIEAKTETCGNYDGMVLLLSCLKRRESWPEQFIEALEACEQMTLAAEIRAEYNALRGNNSTPSSPPTTVVRAHVHPAPSASQLSIPESGGNSQAAVSPAAAASAPPEPAAAAQAPPEPAAAAQAPPELAAEASPPLENSEQPQAQAAQVPEAVSPPEPPQLAQVEVARPPSTPPPSPEIPHTQVTTTPPPQREINSHQEPVENSESDILDVSGDNAAIPDQASEGNSEVLINSVVWEADAPSLPDPLQTTTTAEVGPPRSPSPAQINSDVTDGSSFPLMTPVKPPVQDTTPLVAMKPAAVLQPEETSEPPATQVVESSPQPETPATTSPFPGAAGMDGDLHDDNTLCLSKPGQLISIQPLNDSSPTIPAPSLPPEPYSGNSDRLEMSEAAPDAGISADVPACSGGGSTVSAPPCQENGIAFNHNEPEENQYDSPCQSLEMQDVREHMVQISELPSILNLDGQSSTPQAQIINGEAAKEIASAPPPPSTNDADIVLSVNTPSSGSYRPSEPAPADIPPDLKTVQESETASRAPTTNTKYFLTAAGVGAFALLMVWKFKN